MNPDNVIEMFEAALQQHDPEQISNLANSCTTPETREILLNYYREKLAEFLNLETVTKPNTDRDRLSCLQRLFSHWDDQSTTSAIRESFEQHEALVKLDGGDYVIRDLAILLSENGDDADRQSVGMAHQPDARLKVTFLSALWSLNPDVVFDEYSGYLQFDQSDVENRARNSRAAEDIETMLVHVVQGRVKQHLDRNGFKEPSVQMTFSCQLDDRWLDAAMDADSMVTIRLPKAVNALLRKDYPPLNEYLIKRFDQLLSQGSDLHYVVNAMRKVEHPQTVEYCLRAADHFVRPLEEPDFEVDELFEEPEEYSEDYSWLMASMPESLDIFNDWIATLPQPDQDNFRNNFEEAREYMAENPDYDSHF